MDRIEKYTETLNRSDLDGLVLIPGPSLVHASGLHFHLMERPVVVIFSKGNLPVILLPELEGQKLAGLSFEIKPFFYGEDPETWGETFATACRNLGLQKGAIGMEPRSLRMMEYTFLHQALPDARFVDASGVITPLRLHKDEAELAAIRKAVEIAQDALLKTMPYIKTGVTEKEIASELTLHLLRNGSDPELVFSPIVSSGLNSANPHATPGTRQLQEGDLLVVDWGAVFEGYVSDLTRTFAIGKVDPLFTEIHQIVTAANEAGRNAARPGAPCSQVDEAARLVIEGGGYGRYFTHRTGHGIGLEGHEEPYMRQDNQQTLQPGMVFTVEPGIYLPGRNGVRIEDNMVITATGADCISDLPRDLIQLG